MANVTPAIPAIGLPCASAALPVKFTRRGTGADDCIDAPCWAATREQNTEITRNTESENLQDFMAHLIPLVFFFRTPQRAVCWQTNQGKMVRPPSDLLALLRDIWLF